MESARDFRWTSTRIINRRSRAVSLRRHWRPGNASEKDRAHWTRWDQGQLTIVITKLGFLVKADSTAVFKAAAERIYVTIICNNRKIHMISAYDLTLINIKKNPTAENKFYEDLENIINTFPKREILIICSDTNVLIGNDYDNFTGHVGNSAQFFSNAKCERLCDLIVRNNLFLTNTYFQ